MYPYPPFDWLSYFQIQDKPSESSFSSWISRPPMVYLCGVRRESLGKVSEVEPEKQENNKSTREKSLFFIFPEIS